MAASPSDFPVARSSAVLASSEFIFPKLYLFHPLRDTDGGQITIIDVNGTSGFGATIVNNWAIYDGPEPNAAIVARAEGLCISAGSWHNSFSIVFEIPRFSKSTIQVMGISGLSGNGVGDGEWAIVGGTGEFAMATGTISRKFLERRGDDNIIELAIRGFLPLVQPPRSLVKIGPWGGAGEEQDITDEPWRLESITLNSGVVVDAIAFCYIDQTNQKRTAGPWGGLGGRPDTIKLKPSELLKEVSGTFGRHNGVSAITSLTFVTSVRIHGPFGEGAGTPFNLPMQKSGSIVGFFGHSAKYLNAIGLYIDPS